MLAVVSAAVGHALKWGNREPGIIFQKEIACGKTYEKLNEILFCLLFIVAMRFARQATNQSSHGELSFHHNRDLRPCWSLCLYTFRVIRRGGIRLKHAAHLTYCHCCELCALKQKPGALLARLNYLFWWFIKHNFQLQTVLITASGPQALKALAHRERYTQVSRQNRCVS